MCLCEMADAQTVCYFNDILLIKDEHTACKMWQADALLMADTVPDLQRRCWGRVATLSPTAWSVLAANGQQ